MASASGTLTLTGIEGRGVGWRIGNSYSGTPPAMNVGMAGIYNKLLTGADMQAAYERAKVRMALRGVSI